MSPKADAGGSRWLGVAQWLWFVALTLAVAWPSLRLPYFADDLAILHEAARFRLGAVGLTQHLFGIHNEHTIPLLRLMILCSTRLAGLDPLPIRAAMIGLHAVSAWAAGSLCARLAGRPGAAWIGGSLFAVGVSASGSVLWNVTIGVFVIGGCGLALAAHSLVGVNPRIWAAPGWLACGATGLNGVALAAVPFAALSGRPRKPARIGLLILTGAAVALAARWNYARFIPTNPLPITSRGFVQGVLLCALAPARLIWAGLPFAMPRIRFCLVAGVLGWALLAASLKWLDRDQRRTVTILWSVPVVISLVVGMARGQEPGIGNLVTDRYFYLYLLPFAVHCGLLLELWTLRRTFLALAGALLVGVLALAGAHVQFYRGVYWDMAGTAETAWSHWRELTRRLEAAAGVNAPLAIPPGPIELEDFPAIEIADVLVNSGASARGHFSYRAEALDRDQAERLNRVLDDWGTTLPERRAPVCVRDGRLVSVEIHAAEPQ